MGALDHISDLFDCSYRSSKYKKKLKQYQFEAQSQFRQRLSWKFNRNRLTIRTEACKLASNDPPVFLAAILEYLATEGDINDHESIVKTINRHITKKLSSKFCICRLVWKLVNENKVL
ncbi:hypothetical protein QL285_069147 [Trifolium repens]|nr:hypothetical protein QL285_069147 [Trifolium repens]